MTPAEAQQIGEHLSAALHGLRSGRQMLPNDGDVSDDRAAADEPFTRADERLGKALTLLDSRPDGPTDEPRTEMVDHLWAAQHGISRGCRTLWQAKTGTYETDKRFTGAYEQIDHALVLLGEDVS